MTEGQKYAAVQRWHDEIQRVKRITDKCPPWIESALKDTRNPVASLADVQQWGSGISRGTMNVYIRHFRDQQSPESIAAARIDGNVITLENYQEELFGDAIPA